MSCIKNIAILGGGPAAVACAKSLLAENVFKTIDIFEQRSTVGGVWNYTPENDSRSSLSIPQIDPNQGFDKPIWRETPKGGGCHEKEATFVSPLYERLEANLPKYLMQHSDQPFPDDSQLFPTHKTITEYLENYAAEVRHLIKFETQVVSIERERVNDRDQWKVITKQLKSQSQSTGSYDAVVVASGHYNIPFIPQTKGINEWSKQYPGNITHSKFFRRPEDFKDKKVLVIGTGPSGSDIAAQIAQYCQTPIIVSSRSNPHNHDDPDPSRPKLVPGIEEFLPHSSKTLSAVRFADGQVVQDINPVVFCTGYLYSFPFLPTSLQPPLITNGQRVLNVYKHIFYTADPTLVFLTLPWNIVPFPVAEAQSAAVARVWAGRLQLPVPREMERWEKGVVGEMGNGKEFHRLPTPKDVDYVNDLHDWCRGAEGEGKGLGKRPPFWGPRERWMRCMVGEFKGAFTARGEGRRNVKTLSDLGFEYDE